MPELWMPGVEIEMTMAKGDPRVVDMRPIAVINHIMQGYQSTMVRWAQERPYRTAKSAHFTIGRDGRIVQHAPLNVPTWASGNVAEPTWRLMKYDGGEPVNPNWYTVNIEHEGFSVDPVSYEYDYLYDEGVWPEAMVRSSVEVNAFVCGEYGILPSVDTIIGHYQTNTITRMDDPGGAWPQGRVIQSVKELLGVRGLPPAISKNDAYYAVFRHGVVPARIEGKWGIYEIKRRV